MPIISESDLKKQIKDRCFDNVYFLFGEEKFLVKYYTGKIVNSILKDHDHTFNFNVTYGDSINIESFLNFIYSAPFLSDLKCIELLDFDITNSTESNLKKIKECVETLPESTVLIISETSLETNLKKNSTWVNYMNKHASICEFKPLTNLQISKLLISWAKKNSVLMSTTISLKIIDVCGSNLLSLKNEVEKLCCFVGRDNEITKEHLNKILVKDITSNIFSLGKYIIIGDSENALKELNALLYKKEEPTLILSILTLTYIDMYRVYVAIEGKQNANTLSEIFDDYRGKSFRINIAQKNYKKFSLDKIRNCIDILTQADLKLKNSKIDKKIILQALVIRLLETAKKL